MRTDTLAYITRRYFQAVANGNVAAAKHWGQKLQAHEISADRQIGRDEEAGEPVAS